MAIKHKIVINVSDPNGRKANVLRGADVKLPARLLRFLFGDFTQVYLLSPGQTVEAWSGHLGIGGKESADDVLRIGRSGTVRWPV